MRSGWVQLIRDLMRQILVFIFVVEAALWPSLAEAGRKLASVRGVGAPLVSKGREPSHRQVIDAAREGALNAFGLFFVKNSSPRELRTFLLILMTEKERAEMAPLLEKLSIPDSARFSARRVGDALELTTDGANKIIVRWPQFPKNTMNINGVDWTFSTHHSIKFNLELLVARLAGASPSSAAWRLFLPNAEAGVISKVADWIGRHKLSLPATIFATAVLTNLTNGMLTGAYNLICSVSHQVNNWMGANCTTYLENLQKSRDLSGKVANIDTGLPSKKGKVEGQSEIEQSWVSHDIRECPVDKKRNYISEVLQVKTVDGAMKALTPWYSVRAELDPDTSKKVQYVVIAPRGTDMTSPESVEKAHAIFRIDPVTSKQVIDIRNQDKQTPDPMVTIPVDADDAKLRSWEVTERKRWQDLIEQLRFLIESCRAEESKKKLFATEEKNKEAGQPSSIPKDIKPEDMKPQAPPAEAPAKTAQ